MVSKKNKTEEKNKQGSYTQEHKYKLLQKQYNLLQKLIDNISDHIYVKDKKNRYVYVNKAKADFLGIKPKDFIGKTDFDFFPSENAKLVSKNDKLVIKNKKPINNIYINLSHKKKEFWLSCNKIPWFDKNGNIKGVMGISREVTQIKKMTDDDLRLIRDVGVKYVRIGVESGSNRMLSLMKKNLLKLMMKQRLKMKIILLLIMKLLQMKIQ